MSLSASVDHVFDQSNFPGICDKLASEDPELEQIIKEHGYPPLWHRTPGFESLVHIILEQQVSLASAKAALNQLKQRLGSITPENVLALSDEALRSCYFSRQKTRYVRALAEALLSKHIDLELFDDLNNDEIRNILTSVKGIGNWTVDVYLLMVLHRADIFPVGDLAMINSLKKNKRLPKDTSREEIMAMAEKWKPHRSVAAMIFWHSYICERNIKL